MTSHGVVTGNAGEATGGRGWFVGHFVPGPNDPRSTEAVEVKWSVHERGSARRGWAVNRTATTLCLLMRGRFRVRLPDREAVLAREGDYALWAPGVPHHTEAEEDSVVVTVRWPSLPGDSTDVPVADAVAGRGSDPSACRPCSIPVPNGTPRSTCDQVRSRAIISASTYAPPRKA